MANNEPWVLSLDKKTKQEIKKQIEIEQLKLERTEIFKAINILQSQNILTLKESMRCVKRLRLKYYNERKKLL